jgi:hypothetical protein
MSFTETSTTLTYLFVLGCDYNANSAPARFSKFYPWFVDKHPVIWRKNWIKFKFLIRVFAYSKDPMTGKQQQINK